MDIMKPSNNKCECRYTEKEYRTITKLVTSVKQLWAVNLGVVFMMLMIGVALFSIITMIR